jgi:hypothetical protein
VGPRAGLDTEVRGKILSPLPGIESRSPGRPARQNELPTRIYGRMKEEIIVGQKITQRRTLQFVAPS